jgi:hypothetical protein
VPVETYARSSVLDPAQLKLFLDGIALAEGKSPSEAEDAG